jgi:hypothetical protein
MWSFPKRMDGICKTIRADPDFQKAPHHISHGPWFRNPIASWASNSVVTITSPSRSRSRELLARVKVQFRIVSEPRRILRGGDLVLDRTGLTVHIGDRPIAVTATEFRLLEFLMTKPGMVLTRSQLLDGVWGPGQAITDRAVEVYVLRLRQKLETDSASPRFIHSVGFFHRYCSG